MAFTFGMLPYILVGRISEKRRDLVLSLGNSFSGGIFFAIGIFHLLPESNETFEEIVKSNFPFAFAIAPCGFLLIFVIEKIILNDEDHHHETQENQVDNEKKTLVNKENDHHHHHSLQGGKKQKFGAFILFIAVSIHSIVEGITLGIQNTISQLVPILTAILAHKWTDSMALGINLTRAETSFRRYLLEITLVSFMTPLGVLLGSAIDLSVSDEVSELISAIVLAIATGTFIYVAVVDIILPEFKTPKYKWIKFIFLLFGMILISILTYTLDPHSQ